MSIRDTSGPDISDWGKDDSIPKPEGEMATTSFSGGRTNPAFSSDKNEEPIVLSSSISEADQPGDEDARSITKGSTLLYDVNETPKWPTLIILILQNFLMMLSGIIGIPLLLSSLVCMRSDLEAYESLISSTFIIQGVVTLTQSTVGIRLPVIQGASFSFIPAVSSLAATRGPCPSVNDTINAVDIWGPRLEEVNGGLFVASMVQVILGFTGLSGWILRFVGPLSIAPCIGLLGLALIDATWPSCSVHWGISFVTIFFVVLFSQYLKNINVCSLLRCNKTRTPNVNGKIFLLFPVILAGIIGWTFAAILTYSGVLPEDPGSSSYYARTDLGTDFIANAEWLQLPTPVATSWPVVTYAAVFGMLAGIIASIVESLGDYSACAKLCNVPPPPRHAVNRGIFVEGLGCALSGLWGTGSGTGTYSGNIVAIGMTRVASIRVTQGTALLVIIIGFFGKITAFLASIPDPVIGGVLASIIGILLSVSFTILQNADISSPRNLFIYGISMFAGLALPAYLGDNPNAINTGADELDQVLIILLNTGMFVGGVVGFVLDNTVPGTKKERGILFNETNQADSLSSEESPVYDLPFVTNAIRQRRWTRFIPLCPTFGSSTSVDH